MVDSTNELIIIGGGPAGLTAAIYASREGLDTLLLEQALCGGLASTTHLIENYPGFPEGINGLELMTRFKDQAVRFGANIAEFQEVKSIKPDGKRIIVRTSEKEYSAYAVIVASGSIPEKLNIPGEEKYTGRGVSYCATCDGPLYKDKDVAVIGCGSSGLQEGEYLLTHVRRMTCICYLPSLKAERTLQERLQGSSNTRFLLQHLLTSINGETEVNSITVKDLQTGEERDIEVSGVFVYAGWLPNSKLLEGVVELDDLGYIVTNEEMQTSVPGIYAVGDIRRKKVRQVSVASGEATIAAISARDYIANLK